MKKITTLLFILIAMPIYSQWVYQNSGVFEYINDVFCISEDIVVAVGDNGTILKTTDGGLNWVQKTSSTNFNFQKVRFANQNIGYAISSDSGSFFGELHKTTDGGENWITIPTGNSNSFMGLSCLDENIFFISSQAGLMKSSNGGNTFENLNNPNSEIVDNIQFFTTLIGYASNLNGLYKTTDGGTNWSTIHQNHVFSFYFLDENIGFVNATDGLSKTTDGGVNFNYLTSISSLQYKLFATTENIIWGAPVRCLLNGDPCYSTRIEINETGGIQREDYYPPFQSYHFINQTIGYGCADGSIFKNSTGTLDVNQMNRENEMYIFPNPSSEHFTIFFPNKTITDFSVKITDNLGQTVFSKSIQNINETTVNTSSFAKGIYFLTIVHADKTKTQKLLVD